MSTLYERLRAAWDLGTPHALDREAEDMARHGMAEPEIYDALEKLLLSVRAEGADEETEERINGVMDRLTGWCHTSQRIRTLRTAQPTGPEPRNARAEPGGVHEATG